MKLLLPMPPNMANSRMHWRVKNKKRVEYFRQLNALKFYGDIPKPPSQPISPALISVTMHLKRDMDHDNAMARLKWPIDFLVKEGYLKNDTKKELYWKGLPNQIVNGKVESYLEVTIEPLQQCATAARPEAIGVSDG